MPVELPVSVFREADTTISFDDAKWTSGVTSRPSTCAVTVVCWYGDSEQPHGGSATGNAHGCGLGGCVCACEWSDGQTKSILLRTVSTMLSSMNRG